MTMMESGSKLGAADFAKNKIGKQHLLLWGSVLILEIFSAGVSTVLHVEAHVRITEQFLPLGVVGRALGAVLNAGSLSQVFTGF